MTDASPAAAATADEPDAVATALFDDAAAVTLAAAADYDDGQAMLARLLRHELANSHVLMMRAASKARKYIERVDPMSDEPRFEREAVRMSGIVARMMERYRLGLLALAKVKGPGKEVIEVRWGGEELALTRSVHPARGDSGGGDGSGGSGSAPPNGSADDIPP